MSSNLYSIGSGGLRPIPAMTLDKIEIGTLLRHKYGHHDERIVVGKFLSAFDREPTVRLVTNSEHAPRLVEERAALAYDLFPDSGIRLPEEHWEPLLEAAEVAREEERRKSEKAHAAYKRDQEAYRAVTPNWAKGVIIAEYRENQTDIMTDYFGHTTNRSVVLAFSKHKRNLFGEMRRAAEQFTETRGREWDEHRENYSMGGGMYLSEAGNSRHSTGWVIKKWSPPDSFYPSGTLELAPVTQGADLEHAQQVVEAAEPNATGVNKTLNEEKNGVELRFSDKPSTDVRERLKAARYRWHRTGKFWYAPQTPTTLALADELAG